MNYLSVLHQLSQPLYKNEYIYRLIDRGSKGFIDRDDVLTLVSRVSGLNQDDTKDESSRKREKINNFTDQIFKTYDSSGSGKLS